MTPNEFWDKYHHKYRGMLVKQTNVKGMEECLSELYLRFRAVTKDGVVRERQLDYYVCNVLMLWVILAYAKKRDRIRKAEWSLDNKIEQFEGHEITTHSNDEVQKAISVRDEFCDTFDIFDWMEANTPELYDRVIKRASAEDIAETQGVSVTAVKSRLCRQKYMVYERYGIILAPQRRYRPGHYRRVFDKHEDSYE